MTNRIDTTLRGIRRSGRKALLPYLTIGFPDVDTSIALVQSVVAGGADMVELGVPFSDPLADGPTIQRSSFQALRQGVTLKTCLAVLRELRQGGVEAPLIFMGYYNPILHYGLDTFVAEAAEAGLDGLIVPDLPVEEAGPLKKACDRKGIYIIPLLAPTSTDERIARACQGACGFIYCVSLAGVTGAREKLPPGVSQLTARVRRYTDLPLLVGFGISSREHVQAVGTLADGAVVGSALIDVIDKAPRNRVVEAAREFVAKLKGLETAPVG